MDCWVNDESLFISRRLGSPEGVVQVYKFWSLDTPIGDNSFSLIGETSSPNEIAPSTVWRQRDYVRLIEFLEVNSAMVNVHGHVILMSMVKSRRVGRANGPETYWRCLDLLPIHNFGLARPADTHGTPQFLIVGGDVLTSTTPGKTIDAGDWKAKYTSLDADFKQLQYELESLKVSLGGVNDALTNCQSENEKLVGEIKDQRSANEQLEVRATEMDVERQKVIEEVAELKIKISKLTVQVSESVSKSVLKDSLEKERDLWAMFLASQCMNAWACSSDSDSLFLLLGGLNGYGSDLDLSNYQLIREFYTGGYWKVYRNGYNVTLTCDRVDAHQEDLLWNSIHVRWENSNKSGRLYAKVEPNNVTFFN